MITDPIFYQADLSDNYLNEDESKHAIKVLRLNIGDSIVITNGQRVWRYATIFNPDFRKCEYQITNEIESPPLPYSIHLAIAPTKNNERTEWMVEKLVETGIDSITFFHSSNSERSKLRLDRILKKAISAMKQSGQNYLPKIDGIVSFSELIQKKEGAAEKYIAHIDENDYKTLSSSINKNSSYSILIGPEGGFSKKEIAQAKEKGYQPVSLGKNRLRTETAGLTAIINLHIINQLN